MMSVAKRNKSRGHKSFVMIPRKILRGQEWKGLSPAAKVLYIHLKGKYNGMNNGKIRLYYSEMKGVKGCSSPSTISKASKELQNKKWISRTKLGGVFRYFNEYELTGKFDDYL